MTGLIKYDDAMGLARIGWGELANPNAGGKNNHIVYVFSVKIVFPFWNALESIKRPLESRIWFNYPGQTDAFRSGSCPQPSAIARVLPDGSTQLRRISRNEQGNPLVETDPLGRETTYEYAANGIDLTRIQQKTSAGYDTLLQITWNTQHRPLTVRDAAGRTTKYAYNAAGQLTSQTNALNQTTQREPYQRTRSKT